MKGMGIVRSMDNLGRIVIPKELRKQCGLHSGAPIEIFAEGHNIVLRKFGRQCVCCANKEDLVKDGDQFVCTECIARWRRLGRESG